MDELFSEMLPEARKLSDYDILHAETKWCWKYFDRIAQFVKGYLIGDIPAPKDNVVFIDRSYLTSALYSDNYSYSAAIRTIGELLETKICEEYPIAYDIIYIHRPLNDEYKQKLETRLKSEPWRLFLNELDIERARRFHNKALSGRYRPYWKYIHEFPDYKTISEEADEILDVVFGK